MEGACRKAHPNETGGMLFGEHVAEDTFRVAEATVAGAGSFARFVRGLRNSLSRLEQFFHRTRHDYQRFNYLGEWHSHPHFVLRPSTEDDATMSDTVNDPQTNARFAVSLIIKLSDDALAVAGFVYYPGSDRENVEVVFDSG